MENMFTKARVSKETLKPVKSERLKFFQPDFLSSPEPFKESEITDLMNYQ